MKSRIVVLRNFCNPMEKGLSEFQDLKLELTDGIDL